MRRNCFEIGPALESEVDFGFSALAAVLIVTLLAKVCVVAKIALLVQPV